MIINPTVGRIVWLWQANSEDSQPRAAIITFVHSDRLVNLAVFDHNGGMSYQTSALLCQEGDSIPSYGMYASWMPYQIKQAEKHAETT